MIFQVIFLSSCQISTARSVTIIDEGQITFLESGEQTARKILDTTGITFLESDRALINGNPVLWDDTLSPDGPIQLHILRTKTITLRTSQKDEPLHSSAGTIGQMLQEAGLLSDLAFRVNPSVDTALTDGMIVTFTPARELMVSVEGETLTVYSTAGSVGAALAEAGIPLMGLDISLPLENEALPEDGIIQVTRIHEVIQTELEYIPFEKEVIESADVTFGEEKIIQAGQNGIAMLQTRIRYENGKEVSRSVEEVIILREPKNQLVASGTNIVVAPAGGEIPYEYWYATEMYATWYSPCNSGTDACSYGTASGAPAGYGIVAMDYSIYSAVAGLQVYIPGYGRATIGDTGGGPIIESAFGVPRTQWIDLGYDDDAIGGLSGWVTVYFLSPAPSEIPYIFK